MRDMRVEEEKKQRDLELWGATKEKEKNKVAGLLLDRFSKVKSKGWEKVKEVVKEGVVEEKEKEVIEDKTEEKVDEMQSDSKTTSPTVQADR